MPALLTLQSGAALARSSNLISAASSATPDADGRTLCLDVDSVDPVEGSWHVFDLGENPYGRVAAIPDRQYHVRPRRRSPRVSEEQMCERGGVYYYRDGRQSWNGKGKKSYGRKWNEVRVKPGVLVSATAVSSFAGEIKIYDL